MLEPATQPPPLPPHARRAESEKVGYPTPSMIATPAVEAMALGHATVLLRVGELRILTDPVLLEAIGLRIGRLALGPRRLRPPALSVDALPPIDVVLLSHAHYDHTDRATLRRLPRAATAVVQRGNRDLVRRFRDRRALRWGEETRIEREGEPVVRITAVPARHWGARTVVDRWRSFGGYLLEIEGTRSPSFAGEPVSILFAGDTAHTDTYRRLREERGAGCDLALFPIGAYDPWIFNHCSPQQAWEMATCDLRADRLLPIHYDTFRLSREPIGEPLERLWQAAEAAGGRERIVGVPIGTPVRLTAAGFRDLVTDQ